MMHLRICSIIKNNLIVLAFVLIAVSSCVSTKPAIAPDYSKAVSYNKVRVEVSSGLAEGGLKGYIYIIPDTQVCFRFWGPLGYEIGKGYINQSNILFYNEIDDVLISDLRTRIESLSGCVVNLSVFQHLLFGNIDGFVSSLNQLNKDLIEIKVQKGSKKSILTLEHKVNHSSMVVYFLYRKGSLRTIRLNLMKDKRYTSVSFELLDTSYDRKKCTFAF